MYINVVRQFLCVCVSVCRVCVCVCSCGQSTHTHTHTNTRTLPLALSLCDCTQVAQDSPSWLCIASRNKGQNRHTACAACSVMILRSSGSSSLCMARAGTCAAYAASSSRIACFNSSVVISLRFCKSSGCLASVGSAHAQQLDPLMADGSRSSARWGSGAGLVWPAECLLACSVAFKPAANHAGRGGGRFGHFFMCFSESQRSRLHQQVRCACVCAYACVRMRVRVHACMWHSIPGVRVECEG